MTLSYVDFIAPNVEVCVKYCVEGRQCWFDGRVVRVIDRYEDEDETECVKCIVSFDDDTCTETFKEVHYNSDDDDAWCFGDKFVQLVEQIKYLANDVTSCDSEEVQCTDDDLSHTDESTVTETDSDTDDDEDDNEEEVEHQPEGDKLSTPKKKHTLANNVGAVLFMLSPWIASTWVLFNARHEILNYMARHDMINYMRNV